MERRTDVEGFDEREEGGGHTGQPVSESESGFDASPSPPAYRFRAKHRWSLKNNPLSGITLTQWRAVLCARARDVEWAGPNLLRVVFVSALAVVNSALALVEDVLFSRAIAQQELRPRLYRRAPAHRNDAPSQPARAGRAPLCHLLDLLRWIPVVLPVVRALQSATGRHPRQDEVGLVNAWRVMLGAQVSQLTGAGEAGRWTECRFTLIWLAPLHKRSPCRIAFDESPPPDCRETSSVT